MKFVPAIALFGLLFGCVVDVEPYDPDFPSAEPGDDEIQPDDEESPPPGGERALTNNARIAFDYFKTKGYTETQSAGIVGNLIQESNMNPAISQIGGGPGRGIAQWSTGGRWDRGTNSLVAFANRKGVSRWALQTQLDFITFELDTFPVYGKAQLKAATTIDAAVLAFERKYEICGQCVTSTRVAKAREVLRTYGTGGTGTTPTMPPGGGCFSATLGMQMPEEACVQARSDGEWYQCNQGQWLDRFSDPDACNGVHPL